MEVVRRPVDNLSLDLHNPRIEAAEDEVDAVENIIIRQPDHFVDLCKSIAKDLLDPGDSFYLIPHPEEEDAYVAVDGNRRLAAIRVLSRPDMIEHLDVSDKVRRAVRKSADSFEPTDLEEVNTVLFASREQADPWIERRHGRGMGGAARLPWNPLDAQRFQGDWSTLDVITFLRNNTATPAEDWKIVEGVLRNKSAVIKRVLESKIGRETFLLSFDDIDEQRLPQFRKSEGFVLFSLEQISKDIFENRIDTRKFNKVEAIEDYLGSVVDAYPEPIHELREPRLFRDVQLRKDLGENGKGVPSSSSGQSGDGFNPLPGESKPIEPTSKDTSQAPKPRATLAPKKSTFCEPPTTKSTQLLVEACKIRVDSYRLASAFLMRAFIQTAVDEYMKSNSLPFEETRKGSRPEQLSLTQRVERVLSHIQKSGRRPSADLRTFKRIMTNKNDPLSIQALNDYHHDDISLPDPDSLRAGWDAAVPFFETVYGLR